ncbi:MAG: ribosome recycling factor [Candidatus Kerfeldbacteria bacterium]
MFEEKANKAIENLKTELAGLRTSQATPTLVERITVDAYGSPMQLQELASISAPEPQLLVVQPWDKNQMKAIESALSDSDLGINPVVDGEIIRIAFPPLTEEKRTEMVKVMNDKVEDARIAVRKIREEHLKNLKKLQKDGDLSEDDYFRQEKEVQDTVDSVNNTIKEVAEAKEKELMTV